MRFATRLLLVQLALVVVIVAFCVGVFGWLGVQQLRAEAEASALNIARTVASDPEVRQLVEEFSADPGTPEAADLRDGELQSLAADVAASTGALFVVITDDHGIRLAHPEADKLGKVVSTPFEDVLKGSEVIEWETGTLGESARAKVPVHPPGGGAPVGEISVGFERASVFDDLPILLGTLLAAALGSVVLAALATFIVRRRFERVTLGLQPEELAALVQNQAAVLDGVDDGVLALDPDGVVRVCNRTAERMLGLDAPVGRDVASLGVPALVDAVRRDADSSAGVAVGDRVLYFDVRPVAREGRDLGDVVVIRDRTDLEALAARLDTVRTMTDALRVQRHEFANRLHVAAGLLDAERVPDARAFLDDLLARGPVDFAVPGIELVADPLLQSLIGAKALSARERGVELRVGGDTLFLGALQAFEDVSAILGNLIDNAVVAAVAADGGWVEVTLLTDADTLVATVADSGRGVPSGTDPFAGRRADDAAPTAAALDGHVHGHGYGLPLSRDLARRLGGDVWLIDPGGAGPGAVFGARVPGAVRTENIPSAVGPEERTDD